MSTLYFIRHGETDWNAEGRLQGGRDVPLNALGRRQAGEAGARLRALVPDPDALDYVTSPLSRARETMDLMRAAMGLDPGAYRTDERLKELSFGDWEGLTWKEVRAREPEAAAYRNQVKWDFVPPGGESYAMLAQRVRPAVADLAQDTVMVSHGGVARTLLVTLGGVPRQDAPRIEIRQGEVIVMSGGRYRWA